MITVRIFFHLISGYSALGQAQSARNITFVLIQDLPHVHYIYELY